MERDPALLDEIMASPVPKMTLAAWRASLVTLRDEERRLGAGMAPATGRLLETVGQALAQGGGVLLNEDIDAIERLTGVPVQ